VTDEFTIYLVDDDVGVRKGLSRLLRARGYDVRAYSSPQEFLQQHDPAAPGCAVLDVAMPGLDGLGLQQALTAGGSHRPVIFVTGKGDIPTSVRAMKAGALDFLTKPVKESDLLEAILRAKKRDAEHRLVNSELDTIQAKINTLTPREREVLVHVVAGRLNKQIAGDLGTVEKTIKVHRSRMMEKMGVRNVADLVRMAEKAQISKNSDPGSVGPTVNSTGNHT
jgi:FixJ family two-component response regulator